MSLSTKPRVLVAPFMSALLLCAFPQLGWAADKPDKPDMLITAPNPDPGKLPTLAVYAAKPWPNTPLELRVAATFPNVPDLVCDCWCYESEMDCVGILALDGGRIELRHRDRREPRIVYVTTITPKPGEVEFLAHAEPAPGEKGPLPDALQTPNMCWQLKRASLFASAPDPYPDFVKRCFIFTDKGRTFLNHTDRELIPSRPATDKENNPPWVQTYVGTWQEVPKAQPTSWAGFSSDRYVTTVIGAVSRDGKYLTALASESPENMCQAWHDCMHNNPAWLPKDAPPAQRTWRLTIYAMENDPAALMQKVKQDYPNIPATPITADAPVK